MKKQPRKPIAVNQLHTLAPSPNSSCVSSPLPRFLGLTNIDQYQSTSSLLTHTLSSLPLQTLAVREGDDVGGGVDAALCAAAPHALHCLAGAVAAVAVQRAGLLTGRPGTLTGVSWTGTKIYYIIYIFSNRASK